MRRIAFVTLCALLLLCGCRTNGQTAASEEIDRTVTVINDVQEADIWILPQTEKNMKTTVWGTATVSKVPVGEPRQASIPEPGDDGYYMFRMIDTEQFYYSANGITLKEGWTVAIKGTVPDSVTVEVTDENGVLQGTYEVFAARL